LTSVADEIVTGLVLKVRVGVSPKPLPLMVIVGPPAAGPVDGLIEVIKGAATATAASIRKAAAMRSEFIMAVLGERIEARFPVAG